MARRALSLVSVAALVCASAFTWHVLEPRPAAATVSLGIAAQVDADDVVVARVADKTIGIRELRSRLAKLPPFMAEQYGATPAERARNFLDRVLVREVLLTVEAESKKLDQRPDVADRIQGILRGALVSQVSEGFTADKITDEQIKQYYQENIERFVSPKRIGVWRILVGTADEAKAIIAQLGDTPDVKVWNEIARDKSIDKETGMRSGNLGFLNPDGTTSEPGKTYSKEMFDAVDAVKDGELLKEPLREGKGFAVVWRRQGMRSVTRSLDAEAPTIRRALAKDQSRAAVQQILDASRATLVSEVHPELCDMITISDTAEIQRVSRPGTLPKVKRTTKAQPNETPAGLR